MAPDSPLPPLTLPPEQMRRLGYQVVDLVVAYGLGMAATLTGVGLLLAHLRTRMDRRLRVPAGSVLGRIGRLLPAVTASVIVLVGLGLAASGAAQL